MKKNIESKAYTEGRIARANHIPREDNPHLDASSAEDWNAGWDKLNSARQQLVQNEGDHAMWQAVLFLVLVTIFFPWSLLGLLLIFGWEDSVQLFRVLVIGTLGLTVAALLAGVTLLFVLLPIALLLLTAL